MSFTNVRLQQVKSGFSAQKQRPREQSGNVKHSSEKLQSYILLHRPALELLHLSAPTHEISSSLFSTAWHFPRLYLLLYFPHTKDNWVLNIAPIRQRDVLNGLFSLPPAVHRLCMYLIHNMVNNWFFSACSTSKRNQKLFFFSFSCFLGEKKRIICAEFSLCLPFGMVQYLMSFHYERDGKVLKSGLSSSYSNSSAIFFPLRFPSNAKLPSVLQSYPNCWLYWETLLYCTMRTSVLTLSCCARIWRTVKSRIRVLLHTCLSLNSQIDALTQYSTSNSLWSGGHCLQDAAQGCPSIYRA